MINSIKDTLKDFIQFLKAPTDTQDTSQLKSHKAKRLFLLLLLDIPLMGILTAIVNIFDKFGWVQVENHKMTLLLDFLPIWLVLVLSILIIPFVEEIIFRLFLKYKRNYLLKAIATIFNAKKKNVNNPFVDFWNKKYFFFFYASAVLFAIFHIVNYDLQSTIVYLFPILILPQFILALFIGYLRVRYNFMLGYLMHALHNAFFMTIALVTIAPAAPKLNIYNNKYSLKIEEVIISKDMTIDRAEDFIRFIGTDLKTVLSVLTKKDEYLLEGDKDLLRKKITLNFKEKSGVNLNKDSIILNHLSEIYNYNLEIKHKTQKIYTLYIKDTLLLEKHYSKTNINSATNNINNSNINNSSNSSITITSKNIKLENTTLEQVARELSNNYRLHFENQYTSSQKLNLKLPNGKLTELENTLNTEYGIYLKKSEKIVEYLYITKLK